MRELLNNTLLLQQIPSMGYEIIYKENPKDFEEEIYSSDSNGLGIHWINHDDKENCYSNPRFEIYYQTNYLNPTAWTFLELKHAIATLIYEKGKVTTDGSYDSSTSLLLMQNVNYSKQAFAHPKISLKNSNANLALGFFVTLPFIIMTMPDMEIILNEKDSHVTALAMLMGLSESAYWFINFIIPFVFGFILYFIHSFLLSYGYGLKGSDVVMLIVASTFYVIGQLWFQYFLSTFIQNGTKGRMMMIILIVLSMFFMDMHQFLSMKDNNSMILVHILCLFPFSAHMLFMMQGYVSSITKIAPFSWSKMNDSSYYVKPWVPIMWMVIDSVLYFVLFLIFNLFNPRSFGTPLMRWREIFNKEAWKRLFSSSKDKKISNNNGQFLSVKGLTKVYHGSNKIEALKDIEFDIHKGEVIVVIGPNGAGKSTLINTIAGAIEPSKGAINLFGNETTRFKEIQQYLGVCFQDNVIINHLSVREHFDYFGAIRGVKKDILEDTIDYFATNMQLVEMLNNRAGDLSGGQKRKLCIGLSLIGNPPIVLMDEPTAGVDVQARQLIWKMISSMKNTTSIITSHALEEAEAVSSRLFIVSNGQIPFAGSSTQLRSQCNCGYQLKLDLKEGYDVRQILQLANSFIPSSILSAELKNTITMPVDKSIPQFLCALYKKEEEYGIQSYSFTVEQLEDMVIKLIQKEEVNIAGH
ncbi:ABC transporter family protein [Tritrichomonas foetus]|uniref:ABC transporter family protein n=1 Tax=Tritrichomonas foetus TaxID=1144522 RepID=A0A1J4K499_9EUKA|nr:ABC transporter family protein [Tritrichomonas foetus]|eukprot:OHT04580.1 ABC transporter family protein [Tritrichomonas foetus]